MRIRTAGPAAVAVVCLVPVALWVAAPIYQPFAGPQETLDSVATLAALVGFCAFACNLLLGSRLGPLDRLFGGLDKLFAFHRRLGLTAFGLVALHVATMLSAHALLGWGVLAGLFRPSLGWATIIGAVAFCAFAAGVTLTLFARLDHEAFVYVQRGFGFVFVVASLHAFREPGAKASSEALTYYLLVLAAVAIASFVYRPLLGHLFARRHPYSVESVSGVGPDITEVVLHPRQDMMDFIPGQFVYVSFDPRALGRRGKVVRTAGSDQRVEIDIHPSEAAHQMHPFSIASAPGEPRLRLVAKAVGDYTRALARLPVGAGAEVLGPFGGFSHLKVHGKRQIWVAGGIGITPFLSMAASLPEDYEVDLFYCTEDEDDAHFLPELAALGERHPHLSVVHQARLRDGLITASSIAALSPGVRGKEILMCGPAPMMDALSGQFDALGVARRHIHFERFTLFSRRSQERANRNDFQTIEG